MRKPNFFIIGAPKCGTTALSEYLRSHPRIFISEPKEPMYFNTDHNIHGLPHYTSKYRTENDYLICFKHATEDDIAIGEASTWYLYSQVAIDNILTFNPDARFIIMIRNPVDLVYALHSEFLYSGYEDIEDFEAAWNVQEERQKKQHLPTGRVEPKLLIYSEVGKLGRQLEHVYQKVSPERVKIIRFEDFASDTAKIYKKTLKFLDVPYDGRTDFPIVNQNKHIRSRRLHRALITLNRNIVATRLAIMAQRVFGVPSLGISSKILLHNTKIKKRLPLSNDIYKHLTTYFQEDQDKLSFLIEKYNA